jgi:hypothetical protein
MNIRRTIVVILSALLTAIPLLVIQAQDGNPIEYGQIVEGEITNREFEIPYLFAGSAGDTIIITMRAVDTLGDLNTPQIVLINEDNDVIAYTSDQFTINDTLLATQLPEDGEYTILATRADGRSGDSVGEFALELVKPQLIETGKSITGEITSEGNDQYYLVESTSTPLDLVYQKTDGEFAPRVTVNVINEDYELQEVIAITGKELKSARINLPSTKGRFILALGEETWDYYFDEASASYQIGVEPGE